MADNKPDPLQSPSLTPWVSPAEREIPEPWLQEVYAYLVQHPLPVPITQLSGYRGTITGRINSDGSIGHGTGFSVNKTGTAKYVVTFDTEFDTEPVITYALLRDPQTGSAAIVGGLTAHDSSAFTMQWHVVGGSDTAVPWQFIANTIH